MDEHSVAYYSSFYEWIERVEELVGTVKLGEEFHNEMAYAFDAGLSPKEFVDGQFGVIDDV